MPIGPGKFDSLCTHAREQSGGVAAAVVILSEDGCGGLSVQCPADYQRHLVAIFRNVADTIEREFKSGQLQGQGVPEAG